MFVIFLKIHDKKLQTPLHLACKYSTDELIHLLIDKTDPALICSYVRPSNTHQQSAPLITVVSSSTSPILSPTEHHHDSSQQINPTSPLHLLCKNKEEKLELVSQALDKLKYESTSTRNLIEYALQKEDLTRQTLAHLAIANNHARILELLFGKFDLNRDIREGKMGNFLIHTAAKIGSTKILELLEKYDAMSFRTNANKENAMHIAAEYNSANFIKQFLEFEQELVNQPQSERFLKCMCVCDKDQPATSQIRPSSLVNNSSSSSSAAAAPHKAETPTVANMPPIGSNSRRNSEAQSSPLPNSLSPPTSSSSSDTTTDVEVL